MKKHIIVTAFLASLFLAAVWSVPPVKAYDDDTPQWKKDQTEIVDHIGGRLEYLHKKRDCAAAATSFEQLRDCGASMFDSYLCQW